MADSWLATEASRMLKEQAKPSLVHVSSPLTQESMSSREPLPEPETITEGRNVQATRAVGRYLARQWGDAEGAETFLRCWNARLPESLDDVELMTVLRSILREDQENHPERWAGHVVRLSSPAPRKQSQSASLSRSSAPVSTIAKPKQQSALPQAELDALVHWHVADMRARGAYPDMPDEDLDMVLRASIRRTPDPWRVAARRGTAETPPLVWEAGVKASGNDSEDEWEGPRP